MKKKKSNFHAEKQAAIFWAKREKVRETERKTVIFQKVLAIWKISGYNTRVFRMET